MDLTSKDIAALREYMRKLEALDKERANDKNILTTKEWDEAWEGIRATGEIPDEYKGRIAERETRITSALVDGIPQHIEGGRMQKSYYDVVRESYFKRYNRLQEEYKDYIVKLFQFYLAGEDSENAHITFAQMFQEAIRKIEEENASIGKLAPLGSLPNSEPINFLLKTLTNKTNGRALDKSKTTRGETVLRQRSKQGNRIKYTRTNKGDSIVIEISQTDKYINKTNKTFEKVLIFCLQKMVDQHFPAAIGINLQELVDLGAYSTTGNAWRAIKDFYTQQLDIVLSGTLKHGKKTIREEGGVLFFHYNYIKGKAYVELFVNPNFNLDFIATYFTVFPKFTYALSNNSFSLVRYIFYLARQNTEKIKEKGTFTISLKAIRENLGLPPVEEVKNRKYRQYIIAPIEKAIEEIEIALQNVPEAKEYGFTITPHGTETHNIMKWLDGYLEIGLREDFAETFVRIATKAEEERKQWEKAKQRELARIAAKEDAKAAKPKAGN